MDARHVWMGSQPAFQLVLSDLTEDRIERIGRQTALHKPQGGRQRNDGNDRIRSRAQEERDRESLHAGWRSEDIMNGGTHKANRREFEQFTRIDDEGSRNGWRVDPHIVLSAHAQAWLLVLEE